MLTQHEIATDQMIPDRYQEARLALRDVLGMEPDEQMIRNTMDTARQPRTSVEQAATLTVGAAKLAQAPVVEARPYLTAGFGIAVSGGGFAASATVDTDDTVNGLARLRAHAALDALLDQHGISR